MYSTCLYCNASLGRNEVVEHFPVGRRLAFDAARGRLWAVCPACARWNLTPLEERWEAIETCERLFRDTRLRASTDQIGLARVREGLELVRIGQPQRPEFAAWRYGQEFRRRQRRSLLILAGGIVAVGSLQLILRDLNPAVYASIPGLAYSAHLINVWRAYRFSWRPVARINDESGRRVLLRGRHALGAHLLLAEGGEHWRLRLEHRRGATVLDGDVARRTLGRLLAHANQEGGSGKTVDDAVEQLTAARSADAFILDYVKRVGREERYFSHIRGRVDASSLGSQSAVQRIALEMALHEETERAAMEGELSALADAWREAEEIAAIADDLLLPRRITRQLDALRKQEPQ